MPSALSTPDNFATWSSIFTRLFTNEITKSKFQGFLYETKHSSLIYLLPRPSYTSSKLLILVGTLSRRILQMTYQPKSVGKMADFETLTAFISLNSSQMCTHYCKDLVTGYLIKKFDSQPSSVFKLILLLTPY